MIENQYINKPSFLFFLASRTALTGASPTAFEIRVPRRGQKRVVTQPGTVDDIALEWHDLQVREMMDFLARP